MSQIREVKDSTNIVDVIGERIKLDVSGINFRACCPFHSEKTPSFFVNPSLQRYRCFGCGANGDVLDFLQNFEGVTFYEGLKTLADRAGITLKDVQRTSEDEEREVLLEILNLAKEYYHYILTTHQQGQIGRDYLKQRGTNAESVKLFQLGLATDSWDSLLNDLHHKKKYALDLIEKTGLILKGKSGKYYDRFRGRLMFPLKNHRGQVVGFSGRLLDNNPKEAKYINSPETLLYHKSKMLYGYSELFREIKKKEQIIVVEGEFDVISSAQVHVNHIVAIKGSALSSDHVQLFSRVAKTVILALDSDAAGIKATERSIKLVQSQGMDLRVIDLKHAGYSAKDPDELSSSDPAAWREASGASVSVYEYLMNHALDMYDPKLPDGKRKIVNYLAPIFSHIDHAVEKEFYVNKLAKVLNVRESLLLADLERFANVPSAMTSPTVSPTSQEANEKAPATPKNLRQLSEAYLIFLLFNFKQEEIKEHAKALADITWSSSGFTQIIQAVKDWQGDFVLDKFAKALAEDLKALLMEALLNQDYEANLKQAEVADEWRKTLKMVQQEALLAEIALLNKEISQLDSSQERTPKEEARLDELLTLIVHKQSLLKSY